MKITHNGTVYRIHFQHIQDHLARANSLGGYFGRHSFYQFTSKTLCFIEECDKCSGEWHQVANGESFCNPIDCFKKETGRKISLQRALKSAFHYKPTRAYFWREYGRQTNKAWFKPYDALYPDLREVQKGGVPPAVQSRGLDMSGVLGPEPTQT